MNGVKNWFWVSVTLLLLVIAFVGFSVIFINYRANTESKLLPTSNPSLASKQSEIPNPTFFYGVNVEMSQLLPMSEKYVVNDAGEDLIDIAARLGINLFRITNGTPAFSNNPNSTFTKEQWDIVLNKMKQYDIEALILIESPAIFQKNIPLKYFDFIQSYVLDSDVLTHPAVYGVDLYNEPLITEANIEAMKTAAQMIKAESPQTRLTVGWWAVATNDLSEDGQEIYKWDDYDAGRVFEEFTDFYSLHMYGFDKKNLFSKYPDPNTFTRNFVKKVRDALQTKKPLLIEEFGSGNGGAISDQDTIGSPELQANTYAGVYQALIELKDPQLIGTTAYQFYPRYDSSDAWALLKDEGNYLYPAAYVLQKYAKGSSEISLSLPLKPVPNNFLITNKDNHKTLHLKLNDIVGLKLSFNQESVYKISLSDDSLFSTSQPLEFDQTKEKYQAVFQALHPGNQILTIWQCTDENCAIPKDIFTVSFTIK